MKKKILFGIFALFALFIFLDLIFYQAGMSTVFTPIKIKHEYIDGTVIERIGLGYKEITYNRAFYQGVELHLLTSSIKYHEPIEVDVSQFSKDIVEKKRNYKGKYIVLTAKVNKLNPTNIVLAPYQIPEGEDVGGYVVFDENFHIDCRTKDKLNDYQTYQDIKVIAKVARIDKFSQQYDVKLEGCHILD